MRENVSTVMSTEIMINHEASNATIGGPKLKSKHASSYSLVNTNLLQSQEGIIQWIKSVFQKVDFPDVEEVAYCRISRFCADHKEFRADGGEQR
jgi:hypothetical protein